MLLLSVSIAVFDAVVVCRANHFCALSCLSCLGVTGTPDSTGTSSSALSGELLGCGPRWAPAPGILQGNLVVAGELQQRRGVCCLCPAHCPCPAPALICAQPLPALLTASSAMPLAACCPAFVPLPWQMCWVRALSYGDHSVVYLPDAFSVLQLAGVAGELWADHLLGLVDKAS